MQKKTAKASAAVALALVAGTALSSLGLKATDQTVQAVCADTGPVMATAPVTSNGLISRHSGGASDGMGNVQLASEVGTFNGLSSNKTGASKYGMEKPRGIVCDVAAMAKKRGLTRGR